MREFASFIVVLAVLAAGLASAITMAGGTIHIP